MIFRAIVSIMALAFSTAPAWAQAAPCASADNLSSVAGGAECLAIRTFGTAGRTAPVLVIVIHGDVSAGGPAIYHFRLAERIGGPGTVAVALIRPGYDDGAGGVSTGSHFGRIDSYTPHNVDAVAAAVRALRAQHRARRVVLVGHSGGAAISAVILGKHPGVAEAAVLIACPCHLPAMRAGRRPWMQSESPHLYSGAVPVSAMVTALTGARDDRTVPALAANYAASLVARGVKARYIELPGIGHNDAVWAPETMQAVADAIAGR